MGKRQRTFFWRLLIAFFAGGCLPIIALSALISLMTRDIIKGAYEERAAAAVDAAAGAARELVSDAKKLAELLASSSAIIEYASAARKDPALILECNRLMTSSASSSRFVPYIIATDGTPPLCGGVPPDEYDAVGYRGWGILGKLSGGSGPDAVLFAQPHPGSEPEAPLAVGARIFRDGTVSGYAIADIAEGAFQSAVGGPARASGTLSSLCLVDESGCVAFDATGASKEASFLDGAAPLRAGEAVVVRAVAGGISARGSFSTEAADEHSGAINAVTTAAAAASALISLAMAVLLSKSISRPIHALTLTMRDVARGRLDARCPEGPRAGDEIGELVRDFNGMIRRIDGLVEGKLERERELRRAEVRALQAQINPHFLSNALNSIRSAARLQGAVEIAEATGRLARILREGEYGGVSSCTVRESLAVARDYFFLESWRWPGRFELVESVDEAAMEIPMPRLVVQPIVENALVHGLEPKPGKGTLRIEGRIEGGSVSISVSDDGVGIEAERLAIIVEALGTESIGAEAPAGGGPAVGGIALLNTHRRLRLIFGPEGGLDVSSRAGEGTTVVIRFPAGPAEAAGC
jgi:two-component system, sensor histidine kinase YesM